jgi:hypothetical protein
LEAVPDVDGTEIVLESTANGVGGLFYSMCKAAERGDSGYILIFIPWFWHHEYCKAPPVDWQPPLAFAEYAETHGLKPDRCYWAFAKNRDLAQATGGDSDEICWKFRQEYPATAEEAFQTGGDQSFIRSDVVAKARKTKLEADEEAAIIFGVDIARGGKDKTRIIDRQGRRLGGNVDMIIDSDDTMDIAGKIAIEIDRVQPRQVNIDITGLGSGVYDRLCEMNFSRVVDGINFGQSAIAATQYVNKRAEMWAELRDWLNDVAGTDIPDDDALHTELCAPIWGTGATRHDSNGRMILESKERIITRLGFSPDGGDAAALTFAIPIAALPYEPSKRGRYSGKRRILRGWSSWAA